MTPSPQQEAIFAWIRQGSGSAIVEAVAGSGKTSTLVWGLDWMAGEKFFGAFNKKIAEEIARKAGEREGLTCSTMHAAGFRAWRSLAPRVRVDENKCRSLYREHISSGGAFQEYEGPVLELVGLAKQVLAKPGEFSGWQDLINHFGVDCPQEGQAIELAKKILALSWASDSQVIDFNDMLYAPLVHGARIQQYDWVLLDEAQDTNLARRELALKMLRPEGRLIAVGDRCHPPGTLISVIRSTGTRWQAREVEQVPIQDIKPGDTLVGYDPTDTAFYFNRSVEGVSERFHSGELIVIKDGSHKSYCTPDHHCYASFSALREKTALYIMRKGKRFRIGKAKMDYGEIGTGPIHRANYESADGLWILELFDTEQEAALHEAFTQAAFGLPDITFVAPEAAVHLDAEAIERTWQALETLNLEARALNCLSYFGRDLRFPIWEPGGYASFKRPAIIRACNLLPGCMVLPFEDNQSNHSRRELWKQVDIVREPYEGSVYSMTVSHNHLYVADGFVTHNCQAIYGFTGADADALELIQRATGATSLPLTVSYRCPQRVIRYAQTWVPHIQAREGAQEGLVSELADPDYILALAKPGDAILCRFNLPLIKAVYQFIAEGIPARVEGRDIGRGLAELARRWKPKSWSHMIEQVEAWAEKGSEKWLSKGLESRAIAAQDKAQCLQIIIQRAIKLGRGGTPVEAVLAEIEAIFSDSNGGSQSQITLSSIHKAKGREWPRVWWLTTGPSKWARQDWEKQQELNLCYVATTRAQEELFLNPEQHPLSKPAGTPCPSVEDVLCESSSLIDSDKLLDELR